MVILTVMEKEYSFLIINSLQSFKNLFLSIMITINSQYKYFNPYQYLCLFMFITFHPLINSHFYLESIIMVWVYFKIVIFMVISIILLLILNLSTNVLIIIKYYNFIEKKVIWNFWFVIYFMVMTVSYYLLLIIIILLINSSTIHQNSYIHHFLIF